MVTMSFGRYGLGLWRFTTESLADATRLLEIAADNGVTLLDNAAVYGGNWGGRGFGAAEQQFSLQLRRFQLAPSELQPQLPRAQQHESQQRQFQLLASKDHALILQQYLHLSSLREQLLKHSQMQL